MELLHGHTSHRRLAPREHGFRFELTMALLDADAVGPSSPTVPAPDGSVIDRRDLLDGSVATTLGDAVRDLVGERSGRRPVGPVHTLCIARSGGYVFNPLTVHWVLTPDTSRPEVVVLEVTNTPWKERHCYVIDARDDASEGPGCAIGTRRGDGMIEARFDKELHVSPFGSMDERYHATISPPRAPISVVLRNIDADGRPVLVARLLLDASDPSGARRRRPLFTRRVWFAIHWHALRLLGKRVPVQKHPDRRTGDSARGER